MGILYARLLILLNESEADSTFYHIAMTMLRSMQELSRLGIDELSRRCSVSKSTISKFIRTLGYADYAEFRVAAEFEDNKYHNAFNYINDVMGYLSCHNSREYARQMADDLIATEAALDHAAIDRLADDLIRFQKVGAVGMMFSGAAAIDLQIKLGYCGKFIVANLNDVKQMEFVQRADAETLIIVFSDSGQFLDRYENIDDFYNKNVFHLTKAKVVLITSEQARAGDPRVAYSILFRHTGPVRTHREVYPLLNDLIAHRYREKVRGQGG